MSPVHRDSMLCPPLEFLSLSRECISSCMHDRMGTNAKTRICRSVLKLFSSMRRTEASSSGCFLSGDRSASAEASVSCLGPALGLFLPIRLPKPKFDQLNSIKCLYPGSSITSLLTVFQEIRVSTLVLAESLIIVKAHCILNHFLTLLSDVICTVQDARFSGK